MRSPAGRGGGVRPRRRSDPAPRQRLLSGADRRRACGAAGSSRLRRPRPGRRRRRRRPLGGGEPRCRSNRRSAPSTSPMSGVPSSVPDPLVRRRVGGLGLADRARRDRARSRRPPRRPRSPLRASIRSSRPSGSRRFRSRRAPRRTTPRQPLRHRPRLRSRRSPRRSISAPRSARLVAATGFSAAPAGIRGAGLRRLRRSRPRPAG